MAFLRSALLAFFCMAAALAGLTPAFAQRNAPENLKRVALVIGNGAYPATPLKNPVNDARAISRALKDLGFDVTHRENLTQKAMADVIRQFGARLTPGTAAVFYYAGHGMQVQGRNFLIPVDADVQAEDEVPYSTIDVGLLLGKMEQARSPANIVILDACRDNPFARRFRPANTGLAQMDAPIGTLLAYATAPGSVARDGGGENGVYTKHLVANLNTEGLAVEQLFKRVRVAVAQETRETQVPWESSSLKGEFVFKEAPRSKATASQDQMIEEAVRAAAERAAALTAERMTREQASRQPAPQQDSQVARQETERLAAEREALRQERRSFEAERAAQRSEAARADNGKKAPPPAKAAAVRPRPAPQPAAAPLRAGGANPEVGDSWTYRYTDGYTKSGTFTVRITGISGEEITDEARMGNNRHIGIFTPGLALSGRSFGDTNVREISPYLQSLGPNEPTAEWRSVNIITGEQPFTAHLAGTERVTVPAGTFEARKIVIEGTQVLRAAYGNPSRTYTVTVWYAPAAKRFVKLTFFAPSAAYPAEQDTIELVETNFAMNMAAAPQPVPAAKPAEPPRTAFFGRPAAGSSGGSLDKAGLPKPGDNWTYRYSDGYGKAGTFTVRVTGASGEEISDEARMGNNRHVGNFAPGVALSGRSFGGTTVREISPYLQSLGPNEPTAEWHNISILTGEQPFAAHLAGSETVTVPAGTFETRKLVIQGTQVMRAAYGNPSRTFTVTVWYAPAVKRFVKLTFYAPHAAYPAEQDTVELVEFKVD